MSDNIVIIGTGLAGYSLAREIRRRDTQIPLYLVTRDDGSFYSKPLLSNALSKNKSPDDLVSADVDKMRHDFTAEILTHTIVKAIDSDRQRIEFHDNGALGYDRLVLALGAQSIVPPVQGDAADEVCRINSLDDYRLFRRRLSGKKTVAIIGEGLIACEFANDLVTSGYAVHVIGPGQWPLARLLPAQAGSAVQAALQAIGVHWHLQRLAQRVDILGQQYRLLLDNHEEIEADIVLSAIGLSAGTDLARSAGLRVNRGIVVDRTLHSSLAHIYAIGDCAEVEGLVLPFVMPLMHQARSLAASLTEETTELVYPAMPVVIKTTSYPVVVSPPPFGAQGEWQEQNIEGGVRSLFKSGETLLGFALTGTAISEKQALTKLLPMLMA